MQDKDEAAKTNEPLLQVTAARALPHRIMALTFSTGETRLFDPSWLEGPLYEPLKNRKVFDNFRLERGVISWADGTICFAPGYLYEHSWEYTPPEGDTHPASDIWITDAKALPGRKLELTFSNGETRFFDGALLEGPVFEPLKDPKAFEDFSIDYGVITWANETIDCAPEFMYDHSTADKTV